MNDSDHMAPDGLSTADVHHDRWSAAWQVMMTVAAMGRASLTASGSQVRMCAQVARLSWWWVTSAAGQEK
jgi:hypothetical protein